MNALPLTTERLVIRPLREADREAVHAYSADPEVVRYLPFGPNSEAETRAFVTMAIEAGAAESPPTYHLAVGRRDDECPIRGCRIGIKSMPDREASIGYILHRGAWGQGYATEAARALLAFGFERLRLHRVFATCEPHNTASARVLEKIGMRREGHLRGHRLIKGASRHSLLYAILEDEWRASGEGGPHDD